MAPTRVASEMASLRWHWRSRGEPGLAPQLAVTQGPYTRALGGVGEDLAESQGFPRPT